MLPSIMALPMPQLISSLLTLPLSQLSHLTHSISAVHHLHLRRLAALLSSPTLFSFSLRHLQHLSLHQKSLLIARHIVSNLNLLKSHTADPPCSAACAMNLRDLDAVLLLIFLFEFHHQNREFLDTPPSSWRSILGGYVSDWILRLSSFGGCSNGEILIHFIESVRRCSSLFHVMVLVEGNNDGSEEAACPAAVLGLPSVEVSSGGGECVICKEEMMKGRVVCELPCGHLFHWVCILEWLKKRNACPCCRRRLPTDDVRRREIERFLYDFARIGGSYQW